MAESITQRELQNESGESLRRRFISAEAAVEIFKAAPSIDAARFRDDLDTWADQEGPNPDLIP